MIKLASPLYILREECRKDLFGVLARLKEIGFDGVEMLGFFGRDPVRLADYLKEIGLECIGDHVPFEDMDNIGEQVIEDHLRVGCSYLSIYAPLKGFDAEAYAKMNVFAAILREKGLIPMFHNHKEELLPREDNVPILDELMGKAPLLSMEPDLGWMEIAGACAKDYLERYRERCAVLHFKDFTPADNETGCLFRPTGYGVMNYPSLMKAALVCGPKWIVLDHDCAYERDPFEELKLSLDYARKLLEYYA